jgi:subtilase family serine protease
VLVGTSLSALAAQSVSVAASTHSADAAAASRMLFYATDLGPVSPSIPIEITVWLKVRDATALDSTLAAQADQGAAWLSNEQMQSRHAPGAEAVTAVSHFLKEQGLTVTGIGPQNLFVKASATVATVESAFRVELHRYQLRYQLLHASSSAPTLPTGIAPLVASIGGLSDLRAQPYFARPTVSPGAMTNIARQTDPEAVKPRPLPFNAKANGLVFSARCFRAPTSVSFSDPIAGVTASFEGNRYGADVTNTTQGTLPPCGYQPSDLQTAYNLTPLYKAGLDGTGTTVAIVDAYGSTTIAADVAAFSTAMGLPPANLTIIGTPTESNFSTDGNAGWATETTLDVEWVHAIAPGANIVLVVTPTNFFSDLLAGVATASMQPGVVAISNSWGGFESFTDNPTRQAADTIFKMANAKGQTVNFASGDYGNFVVFLPWVDVSWPTSSPYVTGVGGVSVGLDANKHITLQTSWGNNISLLSFGGTPFDPPLNFGFQFGGGGGTSNVYRQPGYQRGLGGERRLVPDISWVADPYTGVEIIYTGDALGDQFIEVIGGTSASCPMFSGLWGIATQRAHHKLGPAAPRLYQLPAGAITDVLASPTSEHNVTGDLTDANGPQELTTWELALPLQGQQTFFSTLYNSPFSPTWWALTFGTDSTLAAGPGWDPATGLGVPNGWNFVQALGGGGD